MSVIRRFGNHTGPVVDVSASPDGRKVASCSWDATLRVWDAAEGRELWQRSFGEGNGVRAALWVGGDGQLIAGDARGRVHVLTAEDGRQLRTLPAFEDDKVRAIALSPDGRLLAACGEKGAVRLWEFDSGKLLPQAAAWDGRLAVAFSPDGTELAAGGDRLRRWRVADGKVVNAVEAPAGWTYCVAYSPDGHWLAGGNAGGGILLIDRRGKLPPRLLTGHEGRVEDLAFTADSRTLISGSRDRTLRLWDVAAFHEIARGTLPTHGTSEFALLAGGSGLVSAGGEFVNEHRENVGDGDYALRLWRLPEYVH